jgi:glycosyltransferase involved in cell wall biosynthesis
MSVLKSPTVSVVIPVYNRPVPVRRAIESVLAQTFQDFEIIVVDDGSTDAVPAAVAAITDNRITLITHDRNRGGSAARNTGIRVSSAPFVAFLDSDDEWLPTKLERQLDVFARSGERLGLVYTGCERIFSDGSVETHIPRRYDDLAVALMTVNVVGETSVGMLRRSALDATGGFDESLPSSQDMDLWLRVCEQFLADFVPEPLARIAKGSDRGRISANVDGMTKGRELFCRKHREKLVRNGVLHRYLRQSGWVYHREARDAALARRYYLESLAVRPIAPPTYVLLLAACLPMSWLDRVAVCKHQITALLRA